MKSVKNLALFYEFFQGIPEAVAILDESDNILDVNDQFERFFGYDRHEIKGLPINDLVVPDEYLDEGIRNSRTVLDGTPLQAASAIRCRADGTRVHVAITARSIFLEGRRAAIVAMYRDISDQVILLDSIDTHIWYLKDAETYGAVNEAHARFSGHTKGAMQNRRLEEIFDPVEAEDLRKTNIDVFNRGTPVTMERWARRVDGKNRLLRIKKIPRFDSPGHIEYVVCTAEDITIMRERETQLRLLSSMVEQSADPMIRLDTDFRISYMNPAAEKHYGWSLDELRGEDPSIFNAEEDSGEIEKQIRETIVEGRVYEGQVRNRRKDGSTYVAQLRIAPITDSSGEIIGYVDVQRDITAAKQELETKDLLLREVQHRVKNNLATVVSLLALQSAGISEPVAVEALSDARRRIEAMLTVYETLHLTTPEGTIDLGSYLEDLIARLEQTLGSRNPIRFHYNRAAAPIESSAAISVGMIVNELLTNAVKHAFPGDREGKIDVELANETGYRVSVTDDGVAIPESITGGGEGSGLGLTLVQSLVEKLQGKLDVERDGGTRIILMIPDRWRD